MTPDIGPDRKQDALTLVVTRTVFMREAEVSKNNWTVDGAYNFGEGDGFRVAGQDVSSPDASLRADQPGTFQSQKNLFKVWLR